MVNHYMTDDDWIEQNYSGDDEENHKEEEEEQVVTIK